MSKRKTSTTERRTTRSSGVLEPFQQLSISPKKRKINPKEEYSQETDTNSEAALNDATEPVTFESPKKVIRLPSRLSTDAISHFQVQKQTVLCALKDPSLVNIRPSSETKVTEQLKELLHGTVDRQEGNSCLVLGPRGSGKTRLVEHSLSFFRSLTPPPTIIRLSGHSQTNDRLAMREILRQIREQSGVDIQIEAEERADDLQNKDVDSPQEIDLSLPPSSRLPQLIGALPNQGRPVVVILDAFDKFTEHARQALLYCLLDTVQSCRGDLAENHTENQLEFSDTAEGTKDRKRSKPSRKEHGLLVIGITSRIDCLALLEKRVKSRFSHRVLTVSSCNNVTDMSDFFSRILTTDPGVDHMVSEEWQSAWSQSIGDFFGNPEVQDIFKEMFMFSKDVRLFIRLLLSCVAALTPDSPWLTPNLLRQRAATQRSPTQFPFLQDLTYPHLSLLIAAIHAFTSGQEVFTFELLYDKFMTQVRMTASAPVNPERGEISMPFISRKLLLAAFENLVDTCVFYPAIPRASHISKEFMKYYCKATREDVKNIVDETGHPAIKKWFHRSK